MNSYKKIYFFLLTTALIAGCKKEHLQPETDAKPATYFSAVIDSDTIYYAGGINNYVGKPYTSDAGLRRAFGYSIKNPASATNNIEILINNYNDTLADEQDDLDQSILSGDRDYSYFIPGVSLFLPLHATINWNDGNGHHYSSFYNSPSAQNPSSFNISSVENVIEDGLLYKKVTVTFDCKLFDASQPDTAVIKNGSAVLFFGGI